MDNSLRKTRKMHFYPPARAILPKQANPGKPEEATENQLFRQSGQVPKHKFSPEPWPPHRFHQGDPQDLFILKGGTKGYSDVPKKGSAVHDKDYSNFYGMKDQTSYRNATEKARFGENVMRFYGTGAGLKEKKERDKETISLASTKFNFTDPPDAKKVTFGTLARKTLQQEKKDFGKITMTYHEAFERVHGDNPKKSQTTTAKRINFM
uniref:Uncharacterized protein n=1 Tax=Euplotes crassus TaxID=5936 RepID=A0A7S3NXE0_EUPCR|mmetsp:Transcript_30388/g.29863  ORF Transcript_30388/g.29863 Transcript_30388/m.29863 type:complete len:208 (+) Transcript_30388:15-638(+)